MADQLGYHFYDREIIDQTAKISGFSKEQILHSEEKITNSFLYNVAMGTGYGLGVLSGNGKESLPLNAQIYLAQRQAIQALAKKGPVRHCWQMCRLYPERRTGSTQLLCLCGIAKAGQQNSQ